MKHDLVEIMKCRCGAELEFSHEFYGMNQITYNYKCSKCKECATNGHSVFAVTVKSHNKQIISHVQYINFAD